MLSTEFSDEELSDLYRRYKIMQDHQKQEIRDMELDETIHETITKKQSQGYYDEDDDQKLSKLGEFVLTKKVLNEKRTHIVSSISMKIAEMRLIHDLRKMSIGDLILKQELRDERLDEAFTPFQALVDKMVSDEDLPQEVRKFFSKPQPELQNLDRPIVDSQTRQNYMDLNELQMKYIRAKWDNYLDRKLEQLQWTNTKHATDTYNSKDYDAWIEPRVEYMYNYMDYESDRLRIRERFARHCNKKTTIEDIGELLDELTLDSKARDPDTFQAEHHLLE